MNNQSKDRADEWPEENVIKFSTRGDALKAKKLSEEVQERVTQEVLAAVVEWLDNRGDDCVGGRKMHEGQSLYDASVAIQSLTINSTSLEKLKEEVRKAYIQELLSDPTGSKTVDAMVEQRLQVACQSESERTKGVREELEARRIHDHHTSSWSLADCQSSQCVEARQALKETEGGSTDAK